MLSWYLVADHRPPDPAAGRRRRRRCARAAAAPQALPASCTDRNDEIGDPRPRAGGSARALWARMDAIERFAADVAHEIKNPLSSIRSAIETLRRIEDPDQQRRACSPSSPRTSAGSTG